MPYGSTLIGYLHPINCGDSEDSVCGNTADGCDKINHLEPYDDYDNQPLLIVRRGNCPFLTKALHAQHAGAKMLIIVNDSDEIDYDPVAGNAVKEAKIKIPTVVISKVVGEKLMNFVSGKIVGEKKTVILEFTLPVPTTDVVNLGLVLTAIDKNAINF